MEASVPTDIVLSEGVLSFDGRVVEAFGFLFENPYRIHVQQIRSIEFNGRRVRIRGNPRPVDLIFSIERGDEPQAAAIEQLLQRIAAASPNLR